MGFWEDGAGMACDTSFRSSQKSFYYESDLLFLVHHWGQLTSDLRGVYQEIWICQCRYQHIFARASFERRREFKCRVNVISFFHFDNLILWLFSSPGKFILLAKALTIDVNKIFSRKWFTPYHLSNEYCGVLNNRTVRLSAHLPRRNLIPF